MRTYIVLMAATFLIMIEPCQALNLPPDEIVREDHIAPQAHPQILFHHRRYQERDEEDPK